jgi:hypothetical protein
MDDKYNIQKPRKPDSKLEQLDAEIRELVRRRDATSNSDEKQKLNTEITRLLAQYQRAKL